MTVNMPLIHRVMVLAVSCAALCGCAGPKEGSIQPHDVRLRPGDVVFRSGHGLTSRAVMLADNGGTYSHVGIVADSAGVPVIVHAVPDEPDFPGDSDRVKMERPDKFFSSVNAGAGRVMRIADSGVAARASRVAVAVYMRGTGFDHDYDESDTVRMYCCELVEHAYSEAGMPLTGGRRHSVDLPGLRYRNVIYPSDFIRSPALRTVSEF